MKSTGEVVSIGNELLIGQTLDTNSNWIARQFNKNGWSLERVTLLRDSLTAISYGVEEAIKRRPALLITIGGLGPTHDDMTLKGLARALHTPLVVNSQALTMIQTRYRRMVAPPSLTSYRTKMAMLPKGGSPLPNPVGTAPGVLVRTGHTTIVSLPGVPEEMKAIFKTSILPILRKSGKPAPTEAYVRLVGIIESALAPVLKDAQRKFPGLYFKSHPKGRETGVRSLIQLHIYTVGEREKRRINQAVAYVLNRLSGSQSPS
jgi:nicotinamide-nucleotide amidase